jgi:hypothetical protein
MASKKGGSSKKSGMTAVQWVLTLRVAVMLVRGIRSLWKG